jgi:hypothetical protein
MRATDAEADKRTWQGELERAGIRKIKLSHSSSGDVELGHKIVREYLKPHYSKVTQKAVPGIVFAKKGCGGIHSPIQFMFSYVYNEDNGKPEEKFKDWPDVIRYIAMEMPIYRAPEDEKKVQEQIEERMANSYSQRRGAMGVR